MYKFCFLLEDFLIPLIIQGAMCFFCFNLILATGKHSSHSESIIVKKLMYALLASLHCFILLQSISHNLNLNILFFWMKYQHLFLRSIFLLRNILITKENSKMIGDVRFYYPSFKPSVHYRVFDDMINSSGRLFSNTYGLLVPRIIPKQNIRLTKFWTVLFA